MSCLQVMLEEKIGLDSRRTIVNRVGVMRRLMRKDYEAASGVENGV